MSSEKTLEDLRLEILKLTEEFSRLAHREQRPQFDKDRAVFFPGISQVPYAARVFSGEEVQAAVSSALDFWLTLGPEGAKMERELARFLGIRKTLLVNSGSSANLIAFTTLTSPLMPKDRRLKTGDEVITCAAGFPTTVAPIIQNGCRPVFLDNDPVTGNIDISLLEDAFIPGKTKAVMLAHTLGNPFDVRSVLQFCKTHGLWLIEDNCDALGCTYSMPIEVAKQFKKSENSPNITSSHATHITRWTGTWGDLSTQSFYPPHHLTMGEGGAVNISGSLKLQRPAESIRDWGRDCWCPSGKDNTCGKRFDWELGELPPGYDHKYIYSHLGYNLKPLDIQAAIGRVQLKRLPQFIEARKNNWQYLRMGLADFEEFFEFALPTHALSWTPNGFKWDKSGCQTECSWFGFMIRVKDSAPFRPSKLARFLDEKKIGNRMLFGGNLVRQPAFLQLKKDRPDGFRVVGNLKGADALMRQALFLGTFPGLTKAMLDYELDMIKKFCKQH